jgi:ferredoxin
MLRNILTGSLKNARRIECRPLLALAESRLQRQMPAFRASSTVCFSYILRNGEEKQVEAVVGMHLLDVAHDNNIELEGACGGELACATCHLVFEPEIYASLPKKEEEEDDMLDLAFGLTETSRLGCQICVREDFAGMKIRIPDDGFP